jgi:hypothetical protein
LRRHAKGEHVPIGVAHANLAQSVLRVHRWAEDLGAAGGELLVQRLDVVHVDVQVEHVRRYRDVVRLGRDAVEAGEVHVAAAAARVAVVGRVDLPGMSLEPSLSR